MKSKKIIYVLALFLLFVILGTVKVEARTREINTVEDMVLALGKENLEINEEQIKLIKDIDLKNELIINKGKYVIDLNGKTISYNSYNTVFTILGGNVTIKDETNNGKINVTGKYSSSFICYGGLLKIENCKIIHENNEAGIFISNKSTVVQIDNGEFDGMVYIASGKLIINDGIFKNSVYIDIEPYNEKKPEVIINGGEFTGNRAGLCIWHNALAENVKLKGGTFKGIDSESTGIYVGGEKYDLNNLLATGYKFSNDEQKFEKVENQYVSYTYNASANTVSVEKDTDKNLINLIFVDYEGNVIETKEIEKGQQITLPEALEKENYVFVGWDINLEEIDKDTVVNPVFDKVYNLYIDYVYDAYYTGTQIKPEVIIRDENTKERLIEGKDFEIICENNINVGKATVLIKGKGKYKYSSKISEFNILPAPLYHNSETKYNTRYIYSGTEIQPEVKVIHKGIELVKGVDYKISYDSNINVGTGIITIQGIGNYTGKITNFFTINPKAINEITINKDKFVYTGEEIKPKVTVKYEGKKLVENTDYAIYYSNNTNVGVGNVVVIGINNYTGSLSKEFNIIAKDITKVNIKIDLSNKKYTGKAIKTNIVLTDNNYTLKENTDYTVKYSNNSKIGKVTVTITGKNSYSGTITKTFTIIPRTTEIKSIKSTILRTVTIKWEKDTSIDGYEIYRSTSKTGKYSLVKTLNRNNKTQNIFVAQKKGTYYYKIRTYKVVEGVKIYSEFSSIKETKVK